MKNRYAAWLLGLALIVLAALLVISVFSDSRVQMHSLPPEYTIQSR